MANTKNINIDWSATGLTFYMVVIRMADGYLLNDADGDFASSPADPYVAMAEHSIVKGRYEKAESRVAWNNGFYRAIIYKQNAGSPSPANDTIVGSGDLYIESDLETFLDSKLTATRAGYMDGLAHATTTPAAATFAAVAGALASATYYYRVSALNAWGESIASIEASQATELLLTPVAVYDSETSGVLTPGTYSYRVSAINAVGETLASSQVSHTISGTTGIKITWGAVSGATGYKVYGRTAGSELLIASVGAAVLEYDDDGSLTPSGALPSANTTSGIRVSWAAVTGATGYKVYGRGTGAETLLKDLTGNTGIYWDDTGSESPDGTTAPPEIDSTSLEGQIINNRTDIAGVAAQTDLMQFDVNNNIQSTSAYTEAAVATDAGNSTTVFKTTLSEGIDDYWVGAYLKITSGALLGQVKKIYDYVGSTKTITLASALTDVPADDVTFKIINE